MSEKPPPYTGTLPQQPGYPPPQQAGYPQQYPPQIPGYPQEAAYPSTTTTTVIQQPSTAIIVGPTCFGELPVQMVCSNCQANIVTATDYENGTLTWLACLGLCVIGYVFKFVF